MQDNPTPPSLKERVVDLLNVSRETTNDEIFDQHIIDLCTLLQSEGASNVPAGTLYSHFQAGCDRIRYEYGRTARKWSKSERRAVIALNALSNRALIQEISDKRPQLHELVVSTVASIGTLMDKESGFAATALPIAMVNSIIGDVTRVHLIRSLKPGTERRLEIYNWENDFNARVDQINEVIAQLSAAVEDKSVSNSIIGFLNVFQSMQAYLFAVNQQRIRG